jgi:hypothetical protein
MNGNMPGNICKNASLPASWATNYKFSDDPAGWGNQMSIMGWDGNWWPVFAYPSGAFFARGVAGMYTIANGTIFASKGVTVCGTMYSFGVASAGGIPANGSVQWTLGNGYLPAYTTSLTRNGVAISITNFADQATIGGHTFGLVYSRVSITNNGTASTTVDPAPSAGLTALTTTSNTVGAGQTVNHDYVVAVDDYGSGQPLPTGTTLAGAVSTYDSAYSHMASYWNGRLNAIPTLSLPNVTLPKTNLANPGTQIANAFKAAFIYTRIDQVGKAQFSGANNYNYVLDHDVQQILTGRFTLGDFQDAQNLLLTGRASETVNMSFPGYGANYYLDGWWKTPVPWAIYLLKTGDTAFVKQYFNDTTSAWGDSLQTLMHQIPTQTSGGFLKASFDNDSTGVWLFDDYAAMIGLSAYRYIATQIGNATEATWADGQLKSLINGTNAGLTTNQQKNAFSYLPCEVTVPMSADRCGNNGSDANWASAAFYGQNAWDAMLMGANLTGIVGDPAQTDGLYDYGFNTLLKGNPPYPSIGAYSGYSTANNTGYAQGALYGTKYRDLPLTSFAWQIQTTMAGPYAWWENSPAGPIMSPWAGSHANGSFGACPYTWTLAGQSLAVLDSIVAEGLSVTASGSSFAFTRPLYIGRGIPDAWLATGQTISAQNLTSTFSMSTCARSTYGVTISVGSTAPRIVTVTLCGSLPAGAIYVQLPIFNSVGVSSVTSGGSYDSSTHTVTVTPGSTTVVIQLSG